MSAPVVTESTDDAAQEKAILNGLGIPQVLDRRMSLPDSRGTSLSIISILTGPVTLYAFAMNTGGVSSLIWTWLIVSPFVLCVAFSMAEICAAYPISGGCYIWTAKLAKKHKKLPSWLVAGLNGTGNWAGTAFAAVGAAVLIGALVGIEGWFSLSPKQTLLILAIILATAGGLNTFAVRLVGWLNRASVWVHVGGVLAITFALTAIPAHHQSATYVFGTFVNNTGFAGPGSRWYVIALSVLTPMTTLFYSAARDDALPKWLHAVSKRTRVPVRGVWTMAIGAFVCGAPIFLGTTQFYAVTSFTATSLFIVYIAPTFLRLIHHRDFRPAAWQLRCPRLVGWIGFGYVCAATVITLLPQSYPFMTLKTFNWAPVALVVVVLLVIGYYAAQGRRQYHGPKQFTHEEIERLETSVV